MQQPRLPWLHHSPAGGTTCEAKRRRAPEWTGRHALARVVPASRRRVRPPAAPSTAGGRRWLASATKEPAAPWMSSECARSVGATA